MAATLGSGSAPLPSLKKPRARVFPLVLGSAASPFEATRQTSSGPPKAADLRPKPRTGTLRHVTHHAPRAVRRRRPARASLHVARVLGVQVRPLTLNLNPNPNPNPNLSLTSRSQGRSCASMSIANPKPKP